ncbi:MAG: carbamoyltransferase [Patescibacteria group bacterium]
MARANTVLGISAFYHDSAASLVRDGIIVAAAQEERFTRKKHDSQFPYQSIEYCLREAGIGIKDIDLVVFYDKPFLKFERLLETYFAFAPHGIRSFLKSMPVWLKEKLWLREVIARELKYDGKIIFPEHHKSHAASAFFASPFSEAAFLTLDGVGEWATASFGIGKDNKLRIMGDIQFPHSLGLLYSAFTYYAGFKVNSGEYKLMGLAPYGVPKYKDLIYKYLIDVKEDGSFWLDMDYFDYCVGLVMTSSRFHDLFGGPPRTPESPLTQREMDIARSIQEVTEEIVLRIARHIQKVTGQKKLCLAGGVALNCVANGRLLREGPFEDIWIQPASGDAGGALGGALVGWYEFFGKTRVADGIHDAMMGSYLGPAYNDDEIETFLQKQNIPYEKLQASDLSGRVAALLAGEQVVGWFQGRMEFGPRALGGRSILGDPRSANMQATMNLKIKFRESFRPFAPSVLAERVNEYFEIDRPSPYMLFVADVVKQKRRDMTSEEGVRFGIDKLNVVRSDIPAVTHVDYSARVQTVHRETNAAYYDLIQEFEKQTGCSVVVNTSFNVRGEPIVSSLEDAYRCFMRTHMDWLVLGSCVIDKRQQKKDEDTSKSLEFEPD